MAPFAFLRHFCCEKRQTQQLWCKKTHDMWEGIMTTTSEILNWKHHFPIVLGKKRRCNIKEADITEFRLYLSGIWQGFLFRTSIIETNVVMRFNYVFKRHMSLKVKTIEKVLCECLKRKMDFNLISCNLYISISIMKLEMTIFVISNC
jgi:hypothetical protein